MIHKLKYLHPEDLERYKNTKKQETGLFATSATYKVKVANYDQEEWIKGL